MKWFKRIVLGLSSLMVLLFVIAWTVLPPVSYPLMGSLANAFPDLFDAPKADMQVLSNRLKLADGYVLSLFADDVAGARVLRATSTGDLLVSSSTTNQVLWLQADNDGDGRTDAKRVLLSELNGPHGIDLFDGYLYVAEQNQIGRIAFDELSGETSGQYQLIAKNLPGSGNHWRKPLRFGPDGLLYLIVGSSCNVCIEEDERRAAMLRFTPQGEYLGIYASGLRNSAGFDWSPSTQQLYATDNGRDLLGDDYPPCELNRVEEGAFYGWPFANGQAKPDPDFGAGREAVIRSSISPVFEFRAHNAPLGITYLAGDHPNLSEAGGDVALVALHGSWNRSIKDGYKVVSLAWNASGQISSQDFLSGFLKDGDVVGRPAEIAQSADGSIFISDDYANAIYRVRQGSANTQLPQNRSPASLFAKSVAKAPAQIRYNSALHSEQARSQALKKGPGLFEASDCAACHYFAASVEDPDATGDAIGAAVGKIALGGVARRMDVIALVKFLQRPNPPMPPFEGSYEETAQLALYIMEMTI